MTPNQMLLDFVLRYLIIYYINVKLKQNWRLRLCYFTCQSDIISMYSVNIVTCLISISMMAMMNHVASPAIIINVISVHGMAEQTAPCKWSLSTKLILNSIYQVIAMTNYQARIQSNTLVVLINSTRVCTRYRDLGFLSIINYWSISAP